MSKFSGKKPKGDNWGIDPLVHDMAEAVLRGEHSPVKPVIAMISVDRVTVDSETGAAEAVIVLRRVEAVSAKNGPEVLRIIMQQVAERRGEGTMLPFDEADILKRAFEGLTGETAGQQLQDDEERAIDEDADDEARLRRHLVAVHDFKPDVITDEDATPADLMRSHEAEHAKDPADRAWPDHDPESLVWRRVELAELLAGSEEPTALFERDGVITDDPTPNPTIPEVESLEESAAIVDQNLRGMGAEGLTMPEFSDSDPDPDEDPEGHGFSPDE